MILLLIFLPLNFKEYFFNYFNLREKVADFSEGSSRHFSSAVGAYWKHCFKFVIFTDIFDTIKKGV